MVTRQKRNEDLTCTQSIHSCSIHNMQKAEATQVSTTKWKQNKQNSISMTIFGHKKQYQYMLQQRCTLNSLFWGQTVSKQDKKGHILYESINIKCPKQENS